MAHIQLPDGVPGISGPLNAYPETGKPLRALANALLQQTTSLSPAEREVIAAYVSSRNECTFCTQSHAAVARHHLHEEQELMDAVLTGQPSPLISPKLAALLVIADKVRRDGRSVTSQEIDQARQAGADDKAIHDTVLIAAAFCMFNRYVDGLGTWTPTDPTLYQMMGQRLATQGYQ